MTPNDLSATISPTPEEIAEVTKVMNKEDAKRKAGDPTKFDADHPDLLPCWTRLFKKLRK